MNGIVEKIMIRSYDVIKLIKQVNMLYSRMIDDMNTFAIDNKTDSHPYIHRISRIDFKAYNKVYDSDVLRSVGAVMYVF